MTRGEEMIGSFDKTLADLDGLRLEHYEDADVRLILVRLGSMVERFLKSAVWPDASAADTFDGLITADFE